MFLKEALKRNKKAHIVISSKYACTWMPNEKYCVIDCHSHNGDIIFYCHSLESRNMTPIYVIKEKVLFSGNWIAGRYEGEI